MGVLGLGLIGGSIAKALSHAGGSVHGFDIDSQTCLEAQRDGITVAPTIHELAASCDILFLATPMSAYADVAAQIAKLNCERKLLIVDVGSARAAFDEFVRIAGGNSSLRFLGSHPMAGSEHQGYRYARADLFAGCTWITLVAPDTTFDDFADAADLMLRLGAAVLTVDSASHDDAVARVSHLSHVLAGVLARSVATAPATALSLRVAGGSFRDGTRVMSSRPDFVADLCTFNRAALLPVLRDAAADLAECIESLELVDRERLESFFASAYRARQAFLSLSTHETADDCPITAQDDWRSVLVDLGRRGRRIVSIEAADQADSSAIRVLRVL